MGFQTDYLVIVFMLFSGDVVTRLLSCMITQITCRLFIQRMHYNEYDLKAVNEATMVF